MRARLVKGAGISIALASACFLGSFLLFVRTLERHEPADLPPAEGIVVLTGGADRLADGLNLLEADKGKRLLLSGVNQSTKLIDLKRLMPARARMLTCCVDLDYAAGNTRGNAVEAARWAKNNSFTHLLVVTASYHIPRTRLEFSRQMPGATLAFYPVVPDIVGLKKWWKEPHLLRILLLEHAKYRLAQVRILLNLGPHPAAGA